jgi:hypothetical protein
VVVEKSLKEKNSDKEKISNKEDTNGLEIFSKTDDKKEGETCSI